MILESLRELALREGLVDDPAFESKPVRWVIELYPDGRFLQLYDSNSPEVLPESSKKKPRMEAMLRVIPRRQVRSSGIKADFLVDNAKYVMGLDADPTANDPKNAERHLAYVSLLKAAPQDSPELQAVLAFLATDAERSACAVDLAKQGGFASNDLFTFEIEGVFLNDVEELRAHWAASNQQSLDGHTQVQCLVCGEHHPPARQHNFIQIRGASTSGVPLVSFNADAFEKYGWSGNANAPVCTGCMTAYVEALRRLTRARYEKPGGGGKVSALSTVLNDDTTAIYWSDNDDPLTLGLKGLRDDPKSVKSLLDSPHKGNEYGLRNATRFFCLILTGVQGRAVVRRMHTGTVAEVARSLRRYFAAIHTARFHEDAPIPDFLLLRSLALNGELKRLPAELASELWLSALFGLPLSRNFLAVIVTRNRVEKQDLRRGKWKVGRERAALLQFYFTTHGKEISTDKALRSDAGAEETAKMGLDESSMDRAYVFGRVLATAERMQMLAQSQGVNRTLVDRFFAMASVRPKVVFNELMKLYGYHRSKAMRDIPPLARKTDRLWGDLLFRMEADSNDPKQDSLGSPFALEEQGRFGLGYYHQRQKFLIDALQAREERESRSKSDPVTSIDDPTLSAEETAA